MDEQWGFLRAWCAPVRGALSIERALQPHVPYERFDWIRVEVSLLSGGGGTAARLRSVRHALVLLAVVAHIDPVAWRHALIEYCALDTENEDDILESEDFGPRFLLCAEAIPGLKLNEWPGGVALLNLTGSVDKQQEKAFAAAVKRAASMCCGVVDEVIEISLTVRVSPAYVDEHVEDMEEYLRSMWIVMSEIKAAHGGYRLPGTSVADDGEIAVPECVFVLGHMEMDSTRRELTPGLVDMLEKIISDSDRLGVSQLAVNICADSSEVFSHDTAVKAMGLLLQTLLCKSDKPLRAVLDAVSMDCQNLSEPDFARLCSAIAAATSTQRLTLSLDMDESDAEERGSMWEHLAFALFSKHSRSTVTNLTLFGVHISNDDAELISLLLDAEDPSAVLYGVIESQNDGVNARGNDNVETIASQHQAWALPKGTTLSLRQMSPDEEIFSLPTVLLEDDIKRVSMLDDNGESRDVTVLVPGYGVCKTGRDRLMASATSQQDSVAPTATVTALTLMFETGDRDARNGLPLLLARIGGKLTYLWLQIINFDEQLHLDELLRFCPNLTTLVIHGIVVHTASLLRAYRDFNLQIRELRCEFDDVSLIAAELANSSTLISQNLRSLSYSFQPRGHPVIDEHFVAIEEMLQRNRTLEYLDLMVPLDKADQVSVALKATHNALLPAMRGPLPVSCRLAFISVLGHSDLDQQLPSSLKRVKRESSTARCDSGSLPRPIDRHVIAKIFEFAAISVQRKVFIRHYRPRLA